MANIAFNTQISSLLKTRFSVALAILPISVMFSSFALVWLIAVWLNLDTETPLSQIENSGLWIGFGLIVFVGLMIAFYIFGWLINAAICATAFGWDKDKIKRVFLHSQVPDSWLKDGSNLKSAMAKRMSQWHKERANGKLAYVVTSGVLSWGLAMFLVMAVVPALKSPDPIDPITLLWQAGIWATGGALFGLFMWRSSERQYADYLSETPDFDPTAKIETKAVPKKKQIYLLVLIYGVGALIFFVGIKYSSSNSAKSTAEILTETVAEIQQRLPITLDEETVWIASSALEETFTYTYQLPNYLKENIDIPVFIESMTPDIKTSVCDGEPMKVFRDLKAVINYDYVDSAGTLITQIQVDTKNCGQSNNG